MAVVPFTPITDYCDESAVNKRELTATNPGTYGCTILRPLDRVHSCYLWFIGHGVRERRNSGATRTNSEREYCVRSSIETRPYVGRVYLRVIELHSVQSKGSSKV